MVICSLGQQLEVAPPAGVHERNQRRRGPIGAGGVCDAGPGLDAAPLQRHSLLLPGEIQPHAAVMELHLLQRVSERERDD